MCSCSPPPIAPAIEKHSSTKDHCAAVVLIDASLFPSRFSSFKASTTPWSSQGIAATAIHMALCEA
jgi:hypothetical protein